MNHLSVPWVCAIFLLPAFLSAGEVFEEAHLQETQQLQHDSLTLEIRVP